MKVLFLSEFSSSLPLAIMIQDQGHDVRFFVHESDCKEIGDGFVKKVDSWEPSSDWADLIINDFTRWGEKNEALRKKGKAVIGGTVLTDHLEEDRYAGQKVMKAAGMDILESNDFSDLEEAISYIHSNPAMYVVKVSGKAQEDSSLTHVGESEDGEDAITMLEHFKEKMGGKIDSVCVQLKIEGVEVAIGGFFDGNDFLEPVFLNFEHKKLMPGPLSSGIGPNTGEMGTCAIWVSKDQPIYKKTLKPMVEVLKRENYHGYFDINLIVHDEEDRGPHIHPLEMTNRFGWPTLPLQIETLQDNDLAEFFFELASGKSMSPRISNPWSTCVVIGTPPFPYDDKALFKKYAEGTPVLFKENYFSGIYPADIKYEEGQWIMAGSGGHVAVCCGSGDSLKDSVSQAYERVDNVMVPSKMYRTDIGSHVAKYMEELEEWGFIENK